ncbi:carboxyl transferase domain-containing protein [Tardiphaga sp.]|uniref:acetyl-CoA carboxylase family protein n=1 Tax=Tardiphaga sp. TaxID=1926292 RepID=UPI00261538CF|nr:carboxyl transferase domain-containing protein [Tardiphaga sp.]MDB5620175.1 Carbamoyl-phosphate synthase large subunit [Tardiphaga sp.]
MKEWVKLAVSSRKMLIANRGEIAVRIARTAAALGIRTCAIYPEDDAGSRHVATSDWAVRIPGRGAAAYLDHAEIVRTAVREGCDLIHPGYGFLSENPDFADACIANGLTFIGPNGDALKALGDKVQARQIARRLSVPLIEGLDVVNMPEELASFFDAQGGSAIVIKAVSGGGGRGIRIVKKRDDIAEALRGCRAEALAAFGDQNVYVERLVERARHVEVQVIADGEGGVIHLWNRECSLQRRNQKIIEIAPCLWLSPDLADAMLKDACRIVQAVDYVGLATVEFLYDVDRNEYAFMEVNPRIQVEHTVTEEILDLDLVALQIAVCTGSSLQQLGLSQQSIPQPREVAIQARVNAEIMAADGTASPAVGMVSLYEPPGGPKVRVDGAGFSGLMLTPYYDSLLAKVIVRADGGWEAARAGLDRALSEFQVAGVETNIGFLRSVLRLAEVRSGEFTTRLIDQKTRELVEGNIPPQKFETAPATTQGIAQAGLSIGGGNVGVPSPMAGVLISLLVAENEPVGVGMPVAVLEAMKMEHVVTSQVAGYVRQLAPVGCTVGKNDMLIVVAPAEVEVAAEAVASVVDPDAIRPDLQDVLDRLALCEDVARPAAIARRHNSGKRTARENVADICDHGSFVEYGALAVAAQRGRHSEEYLRANSPADGIVAGIGCINGDEFGSDRSRVAVMAYDYSVFAGTQGHFGHRKTDRLLSIAEKAALPVVIFAEGGGGRPGDTDNKPGVNLANPTFWKMARISGIAPLVGIASGRCFAGNAAVLGVCDVVIATEDASIGMGGPAMIEAAGLGTCSPEEVGPAATHTANGVIDVLVRDEAEATAVAKKYLSYFQGNTKNWDASDQRTLRAAVPTDRKRAYDVMPIIETVFDIGSTLELRRGFGRGLITALARLEGRACGVIANVSAINGGAVDRDEADKAARFMRLCDAYDIPIVSFIDTPGFMVGPEAETRANVRHFSRVFLAGASLTTPMISVVLRKAYGLGAMAMSGGSFHESSQLTFSWPSGEFGAMGLEGAARLGFRKELEGIDDIGDRERRYREIVDGMYQAGKAVSIAPYLSIDAVADPADTRSLLASGLGAFAKMHGEKRSKRSFIDAW